MNVPDDLRAKAKLYEERNKVYGDNYKKYGAMAKALLGEVQLTTADDHGRFAILTHIMTKLSRYAENFNHGGHADSLDDIAVYAMMLKELDARYLACEAGRKP